MAISTDYLNESSFGVPIVIPISSSSPPLRIHVDVPAGEGGLAKSSRIKCDQIGKADIRRFRTEGRIGTFPASTLRKGYWSCSVDPSSPERHFPSTVNRSYIPAAFCGVTMSDSIT